MPTLPKQRLFKTLQDRLVKEMRLVGVSTIEEANKFLISYLPRHNRRFAVPPKKRGNLHRKATGIDLDAILCTKTTRSIRNDHTIQHGKRLYQIDDRVRTKKIIVEDRIDGTMRLQHNGASVRFHEITQRPAKEQKASPPPHSEKGPCSSCRSSLEKGVVKEGTCRGRTRGKHDESINEIGIRIGTDRGRHTGHFYFDLTGIVAEKAQNT